jgi:Mrp family chromosome partitioning ATPase/capsular polysaccharide biosynthesis protein
MMAAMSSERHETVRLEDYLRILKERAWVIVPCVLAVFLVVLMSSLRTTPLYSASAELQYGKSSMNAAVFGIEALGYDFDRDRSIQSAIAAVGKNATIAEDVKAELRKNGSPGGDLSAASLSGLVSASGGQGNDFVSISVTSANPALAAAVANAFADQFVSYRQELARFLVAEARTTINEEIQAMTPAELQSDYGLMMQDKYASLRIVEAMQDGDFKLLARASVPGAPFTPQTRRDVTLALVLGLVLGIGLAFLLEYLDKRIKDERTLEKVSGLPVLAGVPVVGRAWKKARHGERVADVVGFAGDRSPLLESFRTLRSTLQYFNVDGNLRKILVTSGLPQEGKTVTTVNLAISLAMSGKRVIVLEADLRRPMVHEYLGLANEVGLSTVLAGNSSVPAAIQLVSMDSFIPARARKGENGPAPALLRKNLYCITSGPLPPNPAELLQSTRMIDIICELEQLADYVLVDTPPVLPVSDAVALAPNMDAVIIATRLHSTTRDELTQVHGLLQRAGAHVIGVVAGGVKVRRGRYYRRGYYYRYGGYGYH